LAALLVLQADRSQARGASEPPAATPAANADEPLADGEAHRPLPDYGRPRQESCWTQAALAIPRAALAPLYVTSHLVAQPLTAAGVFVEKHHLRERLHDFFTFGPEQRLALYPIVWIDLGFRPLAGAQFSWNPRGRANELQLRATTGGSNWWSVSGAWRVPLDERQLSLRSSFTRRDDALYYGADGNSQSRPTRYEERRWDSWAELGMALGPGLALASSLHHQWWETELDPATPSRSLADALDAAQPGDAPGLAGGLHVLGSGLRLAYDNRRGRVTRPARDAAALAHVSGSGLAAHVALLQHTGLRRMPAAAGEARLPAWWSFAASATGTLDVTGTQRRVELELYAASADPLPGAARVPFTEQVSLGGSKPLPGFGSRRLVDRSAAAATLRYRWPIWSELDGTLEYGVGNVFGPHWRGLSVDDARASLAVGMATAAASNQVFELLLAVGSQPFSAGGQLESWRLAVGWNASL
jgi:hypothetical protein